MNTCLCIKDYPFCSAYKGNKYYYSDYNRFYTQVFCFESGRQIGSIYVERFNNHFKNIVELRTEKLNKLI